MDRNAKGRGAGVYVAAFLAILVFFFLFKGLFRTEGMYNYQTFLECAERGQISRVEIRPNEQVPTGQMTAILYDGTKMVVNVSDVAEAEAKLIEIHAQKKQEKKGIIRPMRTRRQSRKPPPKNTILKATVTYIMLLHSGGKTATPT